VESDGRRRRRESKSGGGKMTHNVRRVGMLAGPSSPPVILLLDKIL
jgi:hypothetical protein